MSGRFAWLSPLASSDFRGRDALVLRFFDPQTRNFETASEEFRWQ